MSEECKVKISNSQKGKLKTEETKIKMRKPKEKIKCNRCGKIGGSSLMKRYHFDNCNFHNDLT